MSKKYVAVNEAGRRIGQDHPKAKLTDHEVELFFKLRDEEGWGSKRLARTFEISRAHAQRLIQGRQRCQTPARFKFVDDGAL